MRIPLGRKTSISNQSTVRLERAKAIAERQNPGMMLRNQKIHLQRGPEASAPSMTGQTLGAVVILVGR